MTQLTVPVGVTCRGGAGGMSGGSMPESSPQVSQVPGKMT